MLPDELPDEFWCFVPVRLGRQVEVGLSVFLRQPRIPAMVISNRHIVDGVEDALFTHFEVILDAIYQASMELR